MNQFFSLFLQIKIEDERWDTIGDTTTGIDLMIDEIVIVDTIATGTEAAMTAIETEEVTTGTATGIIAGVVATTIVEVCLRLIINQI